MGPLQLLVLGYDEPRFSGEALAEARRLEQEGTVRVVDVLVVRREGAGELEVLEVEGLDGGSVARGLLEAEGGGEPGDGAGWSLVDAVPAGGVAVIVLLEHRWATGLVEAITRTGGRPLDEFWLGADDRARVERLIREGEDTRDE